MRIVIFENYLFHRHCFLRRRVLSRGLPELQPVALRIANPSEPAVLQILHLLCDLHMFPSKLSKDPVEISHSVVYHELFLRVTEVTGVRWERGPNSVAELFRILRAAPCEEHSVLSSLQPEM